MLILPTAKAKAQSASNYNLGSAARSKETTLQAGQSASITRGGQAVTIKSGALLTPAERVALTQVLSSGQQSLILNARGVAIGGQFSSADLSSKVGNLGVPHGVTGYLNFSQQSSLSLSGNLLNSGSLYAFSSNAANSTGTISASNIVNYFNGLISSNLHGSFANASQALPSFNLVLHAINNITNHGVISSSGSLTLSAGGSLLNAPQTLAQNTQALIQAQNNLNIVSSSIINSGNLSSLASNINVSSSLDKLDFNNTRGAVKALLGDINISNLSSSALSSLNLHGGNFYSQNLNLSAPNGAIEANLDDVSGWINVNACKANVGASTDNLKLGNLNISGDPTFFNTGGTLTLASLSNTGGNALALLASHDVIVSSGTIDTTNPLGGNGGALTIIAGANITGGSSGSNDTTTTLTITGPSSTGGAIDLTGVSSINTSGTLTTQNSGGNGGNVFIAAFSGTKSGTLDPGTVNLGSTGFINTAGGGNGSSFSGNVTVIAGATADPASGAAVVLPAIFTGADPTYSQTGSANGNVSISTATPVVNGTVTVLNGVLGGSGSITAGSTQNSSVSIGASGGGSTINVNPTLAQWQIDIINSALATINAQRLLEDPTLPALIYSPGLSAVATQQASYLAQTGHLGHFSTMGETPTNRATVIGLSTSGCCAENAGFASGFTILNGFNAVNDAMFAEPNTSGTHHFNLVGTSASHNNYIGFGFATNGSSMYFVQDFSRNDPGAGKSTINSTPIIGGLGGAPGNTPVPPVVTGSNNTVRTIGAANYLPTSILSNGNVTITAGHNVDATGSIITNGRNGIQASGGAPGKDGGSITITAGNNINLFNLQAGGGIGASANTFGGGAGGKAGNITVTSSNGNINILPINTACSPCIAVAAQGGAGGPSLTSGLKGGTGGAGGSVSLTANNGSINLTAIEAGGGGGAGGAGGSTGGAGGDGGAGGTINLSANTITVQDYLSASAGGGGGAGGSGAAAGGGGGGGAYGMPGFGGTSNATTAGGGGAGGGLVGAFGGPRTAPMGAELRNGNGVAGSASAPGGTVGIIGGGGGGGTGASGSGSGGAGGNMAEDGAGSGSVAGGKAGAGGSITLSAQTALVQSTVSGFFGSLSASNSGSSILALGQGGNVSISTTGGSVSSASTYGSSADFSSGTKSESLSISAGFQVGTTKGGNGLAGAISAGTQANAITINGTGSSGTLSSGSFISNGSATVSIIENSVPVIFSGSSKVTPAELVAINQVLLGSGQTIVLDANGVAVGGNLSINSPNIPAGGFTKLVLPANVTLTDNVSELTFSDSATINGTFLYAGSNGTATVTTPLFINNGTVSPTGTASNLIIQSTPGNNLELSGNGTINAPSSLLFSASGGSLNITGNVQVNSPNVTINAGDAVGITPAASFNLSTGNKLAVNTGHIFNPSGFVGGTQSFNLAPAGSSIGTIANSNGDVILAANQFINSAGKSVLIIASGNIIANSLSSINLSNTKGKGGSLIALAGFSFSPATLGQIVDQNQLFTVTGVSPTGGSINLAKTSINTSSSFKSGSNNDAGSITLLANAAAGGNSGVISTGAINSSSTSGKGGTVKFFAPGGVIVNGSINTKGTNGGGAVLLSAAPYTSGSIQVLGGFLSPSANLQAANAADGAAASILVNGTISSSSTNAAGGAVTLSADSFIQVNGAIDSSARTTGGAISVSSLNGTVSLSNLNSSGLAASGVLLAGSAGNISVTASAFVTIKGNVTATGGSTALTGQNAGSGANISLQTSNRDSLAGFYVGNISVSGYISSAGGNALTKAGGGSGGNAGSIDVKSGYMQVKGKNGANSILASGGSGFTAKGSSAAVNLSTYATQAIPTNFDLLSKVTSEYALPGGVFNVGAGSAVVNGTAGSIVSGSDLYSAVNAAALSKNSSQGKLSVTIGGGSLSVNYEGQTVSTSSLSGNLRTKVTPAAALALYQLALGQTQTVGLNSDGSLGPLNPQSKVSSITIPSYDLPRSFTKFVLQAAGSPSEAADVQLTISGQSSQLNIPSSTIAGALIFTGALNTLSVGTGSLSLLNSASINSTGTLIFAGTTLNNAGQITASQVELIHPAAASTLIMNGGQFNVTQLTLPAFHAPSSLNISSVNGGSFTATVQFVSSERPTAAATNANVQDAVNSKTSSITFNLPGSGGTVAGSYVSSGKLSVNGQSVLLSGITTPTNINLSGLTANNLSGGIAVTSGGNVAVSNSSINTGVGAASLKAANLNIAATTALTSGTFTSSSASATVDGKVTGQKGISFSSTVSDITLNAGSSLTVANGTLKIAAKGLVALGGSLSAGVLNGSPGFIRLSTQDVSTKGAVTVTGAVINLGSGQSVTVNGGNLNLTASNGNVDLGQNNKLQANGGNVIVLASGKIQGATGNQFWASSIGGSALAGGGTGGGIELGAGVKTSSLSTASKLSSGTVAGNFASSFTVSNQSNKSGVISTNITNSGAVNVSSSGSNQATMNLQGGSILFDSNGSNNTVSLDGASFNVTAFKPIGFTEQKTLEGKLELTQSSEITSESQGERLVFARVFIPGFKKSQALITKQFNSRAYSACLDFERGDIFICPNLEMKVETKLANIVLKKGALTAISFHNGILRVTNCSNNGDVSLNIAGRKIDVCPGEEFVISESAVTEHNLQFSDGVGRRESKQHGIFDGRHVSSSEVSLLTLITETEQLHALRNPIHPFEQRVQARILKTASAINVLRASHGAYKGSN